MRAFALFAVLLVAAGSDDTAKIERYARSNVVAGETICMASPLRTFYERRAWQPAWTDASLSALARAIEGADSHGLDPRKYHSVALQSVNDTAARDVLASDASLRLASNLSHGAVDPEFLRPAWCAEPKIDLAAVLQSALDNNNVEATLEKLAPDDPRYQRLREELRNTTSKKRRDQLKANLERWRWMPRSLGERYVIVNIAGFQLEVFDHGTNVITMKTVVGKLYHETPFFAAMITDVTINPWWNVPDSIADHELWPKQRRDHHYFAREHMVVTNDGRIRQRPGAWNSLGRIKFEMPNRFNDYLHGTPAKSLFDATVRAFSHGCIRVERPLDLAHYLLGEPVEAAITGGDTKTIAITTPVPVYLLYWTAWPASDGHVEYHRDVYGSDARVIAALR
jgi:murein L,D-transpeptidase YcbB/YkuD